MAITRTQFAQDGSGSTPTQSDAVVFGSNVTAGSLIVLVTRDYDAGVITSVADTQTNTYTQHVGVEAGTQPRMTIWSAVAGSTGANTITVTWTSSNIYHWSFAVEYAPGSDTWSTTPATRYETGNSNTGTGVTDLTTSAFTTAQAGLVVMGASQNGIRNYTVGTDFTLIDGTIGGDGEDFGGVQEYITSGALSSYTGHITSSGTEAFRTIVAAFKVTAGGGTVDVPYPVYQSVRGRTVGVVASGFTPPTTPEA